MCSGEFDWRWSSPAVRVLWESKKLSWRIQTCFEWIVLSCRQTTTWPGFDDSVLKAFFSIQKHIIFVNANKVLKKSQLCSRIDIKDQKWIRNNNFSKAFEPVLPESLKPSYTCPSCNGSSPKGLDDQQFWILSNYGPLSHLGCREACSSCDRVCSPQYWPSESTQAIYHSSTCLSLS